MAIDKKEAKPVLKKEAPAKDKAKVSTKKKARKFDLKKTALSIGHFFRDVVSELKKVTWASRKEFVSYTIAVVVFVLVFGAIIFAMDYVLGGGINALVNLISA